MEGLLGTLTHVGKGKGADCKGLLHRPRPLRSAKNAEGREGPREGKAPYAVIKIEEDGHFLEVDVPLGSLMLMLEGVMLGDSDEVDVVMVGGNG
ncbi:hypothetical protein CDL15_Pgr006387 [Punica granatum]|uniref:Uncharacterized protein n=1 Tax=Punica granatum TaxID=22663 RepID=A0A218VTY0_PUNGR|nr:hypothetical protein CDL15_Pgr006387 [Punica granatum]